MLGSAVRFRLTRFATLVFVASRDLQHVRQTFLDRFQRISTSHRSLRHRRPRIRDILSLSARRHRAELRCRVAALFGRARLRKKLHPNRYMNRRAPSRGLQPVVAGWRAGATRATPFRAPCVASERRRALAPRGARSTHAAARRLFSCSSRRMLRNVCAV